jgi:hypothetical protein
MSACLNTKRVASILNFFFFLLEFVGPNLIRRIRRAELARIIAIGQSSDLALFGNYCRGAVPLAMWVRSRSSP